ncbi:AsmA family protein [Rhizorhabdus wittichii RW1]|uniref:AsmA family protein n=1 Tax=Rhizorhabdus wittichii (strain DSM 6014 / CCUG 31198 / JCM 15750 / NBRC 105917 / EY 4224 / RW1) TaxID=392499 RepID=A0A9J9LCT3_RHIWR|nr:AsmA family protein [Rhizorhabdus wittichii RW1]
MVVEPHPPIEVPEGASDNAPQPARQRRDPANWTLAAGFAVVATVIGLVVLAWFVLYVTKGRFLKPTFESVASRTTERQVKVAGDFQFYFDIIDARFLADGLTISNPKWTTRPHFFEARHVAARIKTIPLIFGERKADWLVLDGARVDAEWDARKRNSWTFGDPNRKGEPFRWPTIARARVTDSQVRYIDPALQLRTDVKVGDIAAGDARIAGKVPFTGTGTLRGKPFTMEGALLSPNSTVAFGRTRFAMHARSGPTRLDLDGVLPAATQIEGSDLNLKVRGPNIRLLFDFLGVAAPDTRAYWFTSKLTKAGGEWRFTRINGRYGASDLHGRMTISLPGDRLFLDAVLDSNRVDIIDVGPFIGYEPEALAAKGVQAAVAQTGSTPRILPDAPLRIDAIRNFDAHILYTVKDFRNPKFPISNVDLTFDLNKSLMTLSPFSFEIAGGHLASDIVIDARVPAVVTDYDIRLSPTPMAKLFAGFGVHQAGTTGAIKARVRMKGTGDTLRDSLATSNGRIAIILPRGTFWTQYIQLSEFDVGVFVQKLLQDKLKKPVQINCGLLGFTVRDGVAAADPILIDTDKNVMTAKGGFSFKDESLDMRFRADSKKFSLFSGQSPVGIKGYFAQPGINIISPQLLARGGAGLALGAVASPLAAVLAFVDVGDAKAAACGPVLAGAQASAMRTTKGKPRKDVGSARENRRQAGDRKQPDKLGM